MRDINYPLLTTTLPPDAIEWRIQTQGLTKAGKPWAMVVPYADARYLMSVLDAACGPENWRDSYAEGPQGGVKCLLEIRTDGEWIGKEDVAENTQVEAIKGGVTDAFKRACVKWNVANVRSLYGVGECWADFHPQGRFTTKLEGERRKWNPPSLDLPGVAPTSAPTPPPTPGEIAREDKASNEQMNLIEKLGGSHVITEEERVGIMARMTREGTKAKASQIIDWLTSTLKERKQAEKDSEGTDPVLQEAIEVLDLAPTA